MQEANNGEYFNSLGSRPNVELETSSLQIRYGLRYEMEVLRERVNICTQPTPFDSSLNPSMLLKHEPSDCHKVAGFKQYSLSPLLPAAVSSSLLPLFLILPSSVRLLLRLSCLFAAAVPRTRPYDPKFAERSGRS